MLRWVRSTTDMPRGMVASAAITGTLIALIAAAPHAAATGAGWSRSPSSGIDGAKISVASSATTLCQWVEPTPTPTTAPATDVATITGDIETPPSTLGTTTTSEPIAYDGVRVELRLERDGVAIPLGNVTVSSGGAWAGAVTVPATNVAPSGTYDLLARCVVDNPALDDARSFDFDPLIFDVVEAPPPTTVTIPTEIDEPVTATNPVQVEGTQLARPTTATLATTATTATTLPKTGDGTLTIALAGFGALGLGGLALWWGTRSVRERVSI